jgi:hypothetical protein
MKYVTLEGREIEYTEPVGELADFMKRLEAAVFDPQIDSAKLNNLIFSAENPLLDRTVRPGKAVVTRKVYDNPLYTIMGDLIGRKDVQLGLLDVEKAFAGYTVDIPTAAMELGISEEAVQHAIESYKLPAVFRDQQWWLDPKSFAGYKLATAMRDSLKPTLNGHPAPTAAHAG